MTKTLKEMNASERAEFIEEQTGADLANVKNTVISESEAVGRNIENMIGATQVPLGVIGPFFVNKRKTYVPLATTEGALVASASRGAKAAKNVSVVITKKAMTRAPVFRTNSIYESVAASDWINKNFGEIKKEAEKGSRHLKLLSITPYYVGRNLFLRIKYDTADAMGMNMVTIGTQNACKLIERKLGIKCVALSGNMCVDKKPCGMNSMLGRGRSCVAEAVVKRKDVEEILKTTPEKIIEVNYRKNLIGSAKANSLGFNAHYANIAAAFFIATGQDPAQVVEASIGITTAEMNGEDLYFSVSLPAVEVGTIGGGTRLPTQKEALKIVNAKNADELAEVLCAAVLCGELSLLASLSESTLASSHKRLGR